LTSASLAESQNIFEIKNIFPPKITGSVWPRHKYKFNVQNFKNGLAAISPTTAGPFFSNYFLPLSKQRDFY